MTTNPSDESSVPDSGPATPGGAVPPPPGGQVPPPAYGTTPPPPGYGTTPPPAYGTTPPPGYGSTPPAYGSTPPPGYGTPPAGYGAPAGPPLSEADQRLWATLAHLGGFILSFIAPLVIWLMYKDRGRFVEEQAKEALNFQITMAIAGIAISIIAALTLGIGGILYLALIVGVVFMIMGAVAANRGEAYRYPVNIRLIK